VFGPFNSVVSQLLLLLLLLEQRTRKQQGLVRGGHGV
jgi:hypothetical protein